MCSGEYKVNGEYKVLLFDKSLNNGLLFYYLKCLDSEYLFLNLDFDISTTKLQEKLLEINQLKKKTSFSWYPEFEKFWVINFLKKTDNR